MVLLLSSSVFYISLALLRHNLLFLFITFSLLSSLVFQPVSLLRSKGLTEVKSLRKPFIIFEASCGACAVDVVTTLCKGQALDQLITFFSWVQIPYLFWKRLGLKSSLADHCEWDLSRLILSILELREQPKISLISRSRVEELGIPNIENELFHCLWNNYIT